MATLPREITATTRTFAAAMRATLAAFPGKPQPDLIFLGDVLDLSLSPPERSCAVFRGFIRELAGPGEDGKETFKDYYYIPGNHDHSLWSAERFGRDWSQAASRTTIESWNHTSLAFDEPQNLSQSRLLKKLLNDAGIDQGAPTYYPNMGLLNSDKSKAVVFHHGHFIEPMYKMMAELLTVLTGQTHEMRTVEALEETNSSWIDFAWSALGDDGILGTEISVAAQYLLTGGETHNFQKRIAKTLSKALRDRLPLPQTKEIDEALDMISMAVVDIVVGKFSQVERFGFTQELSADSIAGLKSYLAGPVLHQIRSELDHVPSDITFVFGHTHKPFEDELVVDGFDRPVNIYNTGGWVLDTSLFSTMEGAGLVFVDDDLNTAELRLFNMPLNDSSLVRRGSMEANVTAANTQTTDENPMADALRDAVASTKREWETFHEAVRQDLIQRQRLILHMTNSADQRKRSAYGGKV